MSVVIENRKARYDYFIEDTLECGIVLRGNEVKSISEGQASIKEAWVVIENGELLLKKMHITPWNTSNAFDVDEMRERKLLAHKMEIRKWENKTILQGYTLIPLKVYFSNGKVKVLIGLCKGKHSYDKRQSQKEKDIQREINRKQY